MTPFRPFWGTCLCRENSVSRRQERLIAETRLSLTSLQLLHLKIRLSVGDAR